MSDQKPPDRPAFCIERNCICLYFSPQDSESLTRGYSLSCIGRIIQPDIVTFVVAEAVHKNEYHWCWYTPLKGWLKFLVCEDDVFKDFHMWHRVAEQEGWKWRPVFNRIGQPTENKE